MIRHDFHRHWLLPHEHVCKMCERVIYQQHDRCVDTKAWRRNKGEPRWWVNRFHDRELGLVLSEIHAQECPGPPSEAKW